ncbi:MAG: hypothetical protein JRN45_00390 [Nitrososphaerota archaeon]|nr:hypothetical protein [Nitrososphaerota archaeon]
MKFSLHTRQRSAISTIIATILVVAMTIVAAGVLYSYFSTTASRAQSTNQIQVSANLVATTTAIGSLGIIAVTVTNSGSTAITSSIGLSDYSSTLFPKSPGTSMSLPQSTLAPGLSASGSYQTQVSIIAGNSYSFEVTATFSNGATTTQVVSVTAD